MSPGGARGRGARLAPASLRIGAGQLWGRLLAVPASARPSSGRLRGAVLDSAQASLAGAKVLDVFAGSGAFGIEAVSRGARECVLVERDREALQALEQNAGLCAPGACRVLAGDALRVLGDLARRGERFDLLFADPPYAELEPELLLAALAPLVAAAGRLALEHDRRRELPLETAAWRLAVRRSYGEGAVSWYVLRSDEEPVVEE